jgi:hypothetical protein
MLYGSAGLGRQRAGKPPQTAPQQSALAVHGAPSGAQASRQASAPERLGVQTPEQQSLDRAQGRPEPRHDVAVTQRPLSSHVAVLAQHSPDFLHDSPVDLQPGWSAQRSTPSGTLRQTPEQQSSFDWQRSSLRKQPPAPRQRLSTPHTPEQQFLGSEQRSPSTLQPGKDLQVAAPLAAT